MARHRRPRRALVTGIILGGLLLAAPPAAAQDTGQVRRAAVDTVVGWQDFYGETADWPTQYIVDTFVGVEVAPGWQGSLRPVLWRANGTWETLLDQASIRREFRKGANWRIEAGRFPSPIGFGMTENRASLNPGVIWCHRPYYMPLPALGAGLPLVSLVSAVYPDGVEVASSGDHWDARAALVDRAPVQFWKAVPGATRGVNGVVGGGVTPWQGFRVGAAAAWGPYAEEPAGRADRRYAMINGEFDYAVGYTRISGEWTRDRFETAAGDVTARGATLQVQHTLTPRLFVHSRATWIRAGEVETAVVAGARRFVSIDTTLGIRLAPSLTLRVAHSAVKRFSVDAVDQQFGVSTMWVMRWW
ncbi:MAG: hypothetical protein R2752_15335 [Vicinamibacterales bacterium]